MTDKEAVVASHADEGPRAPAGAPPHGDDAAADAAAFYPPARVSTRSTLEDQSFRLPLKKLLLVFLGMQLALFLSFLEQTSVSTAIPIISQQLRISQQQEWIGTSFLIATTALQPIYGRVSDIFGRKACLCAALVIFGTGNLLCGFAKSLPVLAVFRGIAGVGGAGINTLVMIIFSDVVSLRDRGRYQGLLGSAVGLASGMGPLVGGAFAQSVSWKWVFWFVVPLTAVSVIIIACVLPAKPVSGNIRRKIRKVDFVGSLMVLGSTIFLLFSISAGGNTFAWTSSLILCLLVLSVVGFVGFIVWEWRMAALPIVPLRLLSDLSMVAIFLQTLLVGIVYYSQLYYLPIYYECVRFTSPIRAGVLMLPLIICQTVSSTASGFILTLIGRYNPVFRTGFVVWTLGVGLQLLFDVDTSIAKIAGILIVQGFGIGATFQTTLVAAQAIAPARDRAVVTGFRTFCRTLGGAFGLAICGAIVNNSLERELIRLGLRRDLVQTVIDEGAQITSDSLTAAESDIVARAYMKCMRVIFIMFVPIAGICFLLSLCVRHVNLRGDSKQEAAPGEDKTEERSNEENASPPADEEARVETAATAAAALGVRDEKHPGASCVEKHDPQSAALSGGRL